MSMKTLCHRLSLPAAVALVALAGPVAAQQFPSKVVEVVGPHSPGGSTDAGARVLAKALQEKWKNPVRVVNITGGNTVPAVDDVMRSPPDGHKVLVDLMSSSSLLSIVVPNLPYKVTDRTFVTLTMQTSMFLVVNANSPYQTMNDVVAAIKKDPRSITWTSLGGTGVIDLAFRKLFKHIGVDVAQTRAVASKGGADAAVQVAGGHVMFGAGSYAANAPFITSKKVRVLAVFADQRSSLLPDVPSTTELGYPGIETVQWNGFSAAPNTPKAIVDVWHAAVKDVLGDKEVVTALGRGGNEPFIGDGPKMKKIVEDEMKVLAEVFGPPKTN
jgi:tripartite-type tricarboxylate transporter receptor subunit TctC